MSASVRFALKCIANITAKDLRIELRKKYEIVSMITFALISILIFSFATTPFSVNPSEIMPAAVWSILLFATILGFSTVFTREMDQGTLNGLRALPISPQLILVGKTLYGIALVGVVAMVVVPFSMLLFGYGFNSEPWLIVLTFTLGTVELAVAGAIVSALTMYTQSRTVLIPLVMFPLVIPVIIPSTMLTSRLIEGVAFSSVIPELRMMSFALVVLIAMSLLLFEYVFAD